MSRSQPNPQPLQKAAIQLLRRQKCLLALLHVLGGRSGNLDFQKTLFLYCQDHDASDLYEFVPYNYGAFSFTCYADRRKFIERGLLLDDEHQWTLTNVGKVEAARAHEFVPIALSTRQLNMRGDSLVAETYRRYPYYATRSEIASRILRGDNAALRRIAQSRPISQGFGVATIGYEGQTLEGYLNKLLCSGVTILCDVRRNPLSRKYGFSKGTLSHACDGVGIRYEHLPELGIASDRRQNLDTQADYDALFAKYERKDLPSQGKALGKIEGWVRSGARVALTCYEQLPQQCHRHCVAEAIERSIGKGLAAQHL
jgi:uncharacterized protein (DUF488 family)